MDRKRLCEREICSKLTMPAVVQAGWDATTRIREEYRVTRGRIIARGKLVTCSQPKRADYLLLYKPNIPLAVIAAKSNNHSVGERNPRPPTALAVRGLTTHVSLKPALAAHLLN